MDLPTSPLQDRSNASPSLASSSVALKAPIGLLNASLVDATSSSSSSAPQTQQQGAGSMRFEIDAGGRAVFFGASSGGGAPHARAAAPSTPARRTPGRGVVRGWVHEDGMGGREVGATPPRRTPMQASRVGDAHVGAEGDGEEELREELDTDVEEARLAHETPEQEQTPTQEDADAILLRQFSYAFSPSPKRPAQETKKRRHAATISLPVERGREVWAAGTVGEGGGASVSQSKSPAKLAPNPFTTPARPAAPTRQTAAPAPCPAPVSAPTLSPLARNLVRILTHPERLPLGLVALLEACVRESDAAARGQGGIRGMSELAVKAGLVSPPAPAPTPSSSSDDVLMPPPSRPLQHTRSASSSSLPSQHTRTASSSSVLSQYSAAPPAQPEAARRELYKSSTDDLPRIPARSHPRYPRGMTLRFVYETGQGSYEEQREERTALLSQGCVRAPSVAPKLRNRASSAKRMVKVEEEAGSGGEADSPAADAEDEAFVPPSAKAKGKGKARARAVPAAAVGRRERAATAALLEELAGAGGDDDEWGVRRSKRVRKSAS
ncbi:hypothetical protein JCM10449v2_006068 [Rhodotorula kratochvilovae]